MSKKLKITNRQFLSAAIIIFYLIPLLFFSAFNIKFLPQQQSWPLFSLGLLFAALGTFILTLLLFYWEESVREKEETSSFCTSSLPPNAALTNKEEKVTSLDPGMSYSIPVQEHQSPSQFEENTKEINLLETALKNTQNENEELIRALEHKSHEFEKQEEEINLLQLKALQIAQDFADYKLFSEEQLKQKQLQLTTLQQMMEDQRTEMEKRQEQIYQLDTKVHDLSYEIKTLLYLNQEETAAPKLPQYAKESDPTPTPDKLFPSENGEQAGPPLKPSQHDISRNDTPIRSPLEASALLKKCINMAQKLTGANYYSSESSRFREFTSSYYAIDQRRLFENLRGETGALIIVYSQKEDKLLFVNNESKTLLGWSPEKFVADFPSIIHQGINDWKKALSSLVSASDSQARLLSKTKQGQEIVLNCHLGLIPTGLFRNYVIGVLYPT